MPKIFYDTEFYEDSVTIQPISIGMVNANGQEYYREFAEIDLSKTSPWIQKNVVPHLTDNTAPKSVIRQEIIGFVGPGIPEFWAYFSDYDHIVLCQIFGTMMDLPPRWPKLTMDLRQYMIHAGFDVAARPEQTTQDHNALNDAHWVKDTYYIVKEHENKMKALNAVSWIK